MTSPKRATTTSKGRIYDWHNEKFWSVTTILKAYPKDALQFWAAKVAAEFAVKRNEQIHALITDGESKAAIDLIKKAPWRDRDKAADIGTAVHDTVSKLILDQPIARTDYAEEVVPFMDAFLDFVKDYAVTFTASEATVYNRTQRYAGSFDFIADIPILERDFNGSRCLGDVKTGKGVYPEVGMQLAAYAHGEFIGLPNGDEIPMPPVDVGATLHLRPGLYPKGYALIPSRIDEEVFNAFLFVREVWRYQTDIAPTVLGVPMTSEDVA